MTVMLAPKVRLCVADLVSHLGGEVRFHHGDNVTVRFASWSSLLVFEEIVRGRNGDLGKVLYLGGGFQVVAWIPGAESEEH